VYEVLNSSEIYHVPSQNKKNWPPFEFLALPNFAASSLHNLAASNVKQFSAISSNFNSKILVSYYKIIA